MPADTLAPVSVVGFGDAYATRSAPKTPLELAAEAIHAALASVSLRAADLDGLLTGRSPMADPREQWNVILASHLGLMPRYTTQVMHHSSGILGMFMHASAALRSGLASYVLCVQSDAAPLFVDSRRAVTDLDTDPDYETPLGFTPLHMYAMLTQRYLHETGASRWALARVATAAQAWGVAHPYAQKKDKGLITEAMVAESRLIADPLRLWDCAPWGPGGTAGAFILALRDRAADTSERTIDVLGTGSAMTHQYYGERVAQLTRSDPDERTAGEVAAASAYAAAGLGPADVDVVSSSTAFTALGLMALEDLGFCPRGAAADFVQGDAIFPGGSLPFNTNGGWLSFGMSGTSANMDSVIEALRQLSGTALGYQVDGCRTALVHGMGGTYSCSDVVILGGAGG
jgi:acetyl-CoA acetyltransferase